MPPIAGPGGHVGIDQKADGFLPGRNLRVAVLVVVIFVVLVQIAHFLVVLLQTLAGASSNPVFFLLINFRCGNCTLSLFAGGPFAFTSPPAAPSATAATPAAVFALGFFDAASPGWPLVDFRRRCLVEVFHRRQNCVPVQIGIQIQIKIKVGGARLLAAGFFAPHFLAPWFFSTCFFSTWRTIIAARCRRPLITAGRPLFTARLLAARGRTFIAATFGTTALFAPLTAAGTAVVATAAIT
jgi:hypothetical protein